jgi:hypothetical protein
LAAPRPDRDSDDEIHSHLELHTADNIRAGMSEADARRAALLRFGPMTTIRDAHRSWRDGAMASTRRCRIFATRSG